jgi:hypothetical protein
MTRTDWLAAVSLAAVSLAAAAGCSDGPAPTTLAAPSLASPLQISASSPTADSGVTFDVASWNGGSSAHLTLTPPDLQLVLRTGQDGQLTALELPLGDVDVSADAVPPNGIHLRDLQLGLDSTLQLTTDYASADYLEVHAVGPLRLAWSVLLDDGTTWALGPAVTEPLSFDLEVERDADQVIARLYARCDGACWTLDSIARISDGQVHIVAPATLRPL